MCEGPRLSIFLGYSLFLSYNSYKKACIIEEACKNRVSFTKGLLIFKTVWGFGGFFGGRGIHFFQIIVLGTYFVSNNSGGGILIYSTTSQVVKFITK